MNFPKILEKINEIFTNAKYTVANVFTNPPLKDSTFSYFYGHDVYSTFKGPTNNSADDTPQAWNVLTMSRADNRAAQLAIQTYMTGSGQNMYFRCRHVDNNDYSQWQDWKQLTAKTDLLNWIYPVGSIYMSVNDVSPSTFLGGTWERIQDRFLLSAGSSYSAGSTGGEASHQLTVAEMPSHRHRLGFSNDNGGNWASQKPNSIIYSTGTTQYPKQGPMGTQRASGVNGTFGDRGVKTYEDNSILEHTGGNQAHNNMPPYLTVYMWKRIS